MNAALLLAEPESTTREFLQRHLADDGGDVLGAGPIAVDLVTRRVSVYGRAMRLPAKEYDLLAKLATEPERVFTKEQLLREVWGYISLGRTRTLDSHASRLRRKLRLAGAGPCVVNVWGVAYFGLNPRGCANAV